MKSHFLKTSRFILFKKTKSVTKSLFLLISVISLILLSSSHVIAAVNSWGFSDGADYNFDSDSIDVSSGYAQLKVSSDWYNSSWTKRKALTVNNSANASSLTNYQIQVDVSFDADMQPDFDDIRFTDSDGTTLISYWRESYTTSSAATFYVEIPSVVALSTKTIYMYYDNSSASTTSNGNETFTFFDGFERTGFSNAAENLTIPTYEGSGQAIHPDVLYFADGWNGYKYWMAFTPYPNTNAVYENPSIVVSEDNQNWSVPTGLTNPIDEKPTLGYNADPDLVYNDSTDELWMYYLQYDSSIPTNTVYLMLTKSGDGITWTEPVSLLSWDLDVVADNERSYAIIKQGSNWYYWAQTNLSSVTHRVVYRSSSDGETWSSPTNVVFSSTPSPTPWHLNVIYVPSTSEYWMLYSAPASGGKMYFSKSTDRINWTYYSLPVLIPGSSGSWDDHTLYRPTLLYDETNDLMQMWYSAMKNTNEWHTGYTEKDYSELTSYLTNNNWSGTQLALSSEQVKRGSYSGKLTLSQNSVQTLSSSLQNVYIEADIYDDLDSSGIVLLRVLNSATNRIGIGYNTSTSNTNYSFHNTGFSYTATSVPRTEGWHKFGILVKSDSSVIYYIDGQQVGTLSSQINNAAQIMLFTSTATSYFDDIRIRLFSQTTPTLSFGDESNAFSSSAPSIVPSSALAQEFTSVSGFSETATKNGGEIKYQLSNDAGDTWYWYNSGWTTTNSNYSEANTASEIDTNISSFPVGEGQFLFTAYLNSDGSQNILLDEVNLTYQIGSSPTPTPDSSSGSSSNAPTAPSCGNLSPGAKAPWLYGAITQNNSSILLYFTEADDPVDHYALEFGTKSGEYPWGATNIGGKGSRTYLVQSLQPNTTYYFRVRGGNGCATGGWSNEISATTKGLVTFNQLQTTELDLEPATPSKTSSNTANNVCKSYTVKTGDNLWNIASSELGDGSKYTEIIEQNIDEFPSLSTSNSVDIGWELKLNCGEFSAEKLDSTSLDNEQETVGGYSINIKVTDTTQKPVSGAKVIIHSKVQETTTDENGVARFENVEPGDHRVLVAYNGFEGEQSINLTGDVKEFSLNITVEQKNVLTSPLVVAIIGGLGLVILVLVILLVRARARKS